MSKIWFIVFDLPLSFLSDETPLWVSEVEEAMLRMKKFYEVFLTPIDLWIFQSFLSISLFCLTYCGIISETYLIFASVIQLILTLESISFCFEPAVYIIHFCSVPLWFLNNCTIEITCYHCFPNEQMLNSVRSTVSRNKKHPFEISLYLIITPLFHKPKWREWLLSNCLPSTKKTTSVSSTTAPRKPWIISQPSFAFSLFA